MTKRSLPMDVPVTSPYYDRIRSLNIELDFVPYGSPEYNYLNGEISRMEQRAMKRMEADRSIGMFGPAAMKNRDMTYCYGSGCALTLQCERYLEGQRIKANVRLDDDQYWWMSHCDEETREGFIQKKQD